MTGPVVPPGGEDKLRQALAAVLAIECGVVPDAKTARSVADALLPTVLAAMDREGRRRAAEELRRAGEDFRRTTLPGPWSSAEVAYEMDARAAALAPENARPE